MTLPNRSLVRDAAFLAVAGAVAGVLALKQQRRKAAFAGKVVLITGGSRGLGLALAEEAARRGARIVLAAREAAELERARSILEQTGAVAEADQDLLVVTADLRNEEDAKRLIERATSRFGHVDFLINNAGVITVGPVESQTSRDFHDVMDTNFFAGLHCTLAVLPQMLERRGGGIVNIASIGGKIAVPHLLPYTASKFAVVGFSEGLAAEVRARGIRVTTVCPGLMRTGSHVNATFSGDAPREYRWFSLTANLPGMSIAVDRAARQILNGVADGASQVTVTPQAFVGARLGGLFPGLTRAAMQAIHFLLPSNDGGQSHGQRGAEVRSLEWLPARTLGASAAWRYNQSDLGTG